MRLIFLALPIIVGAAAFVGLCSRKAPVDGPATASSAPPSDRVSTRHLAARGQLGPGKGSLLIALEPPAGAKLTAGAPVSVEARGEHLSFPKRLRTPLDPSKLPLRIPIEVTDGALGPALVKLSFYWCQEGAAAACRPERVELVVDLDLSGDAAGGEALLTYKAPGV
jgi:hypothetical protein